MHKLEATSRCKLLVTFGYRQMMIRKQLPTFSGRFEAVDALRGLAMVWMTAFHFSFDLNHFGFWQQDFYRDTFWTGQRTLILSLFLFCAGLGQAIALAQGQTWPRFGRRWAQIAGCALLVSAGSWFMYPQSFIYFGVLHGMAVMLLIVRLTAHWGAWLWLAGAVAVAIKFIYSGAIITPATGHFVEIMNSPLFNWLGLVTRNPVTEDYVPLLPWMGVMWWGVAAGDWLTRHRPAAFTRPLPAPLKPLVGLGRWSLSYYMVHQPVMIGGLMAVSWVVK